MSVHPLSSKRPNGGRSETSPTSAARSGRPRGSRRNVLIRPAWVRATELLAASDRDTTRLNVDSRTRCAA